MSSGLIVVKANSLIEASYRLSIDEVRILALTIGTMDPKSNQKIFDFSIDDFMRQFPDLKKDSVYEQIKSAIKRISERWVKTEDSERITEFRWVSSRTYFKKEGRFRIAMTDEIMPYLTQLKGQFTQYQLKNIAYFNSVHSIRIYELITQHRSKGFREITVEDLKKWLQLEEKYSVFFDFKKRVLEPAITEINERADLFVEVEQIKRGRAIHALKFIIQAKKNTVSIEHKRPAFPHKNKYGKFVKLDRQNPKMSSVEYANYAQDCLKILDDFYETLEGVTVTDLAYYWTFLATNYSFKSKLGTKQTFLEELRKRGYKLVDCEAVEIPKKQIDFVSIND